MSSKINSTTKIMLILTVLGCVIPTVYLNIFDFSFLIYHEQLTLYAQNIRLICCLLGIAVGVAVGIAEIFCKKDNKNDKAIRRSCIMFCFVAFILHIFSLLSDPSEKARRISCSSNLKQIYLALHQYAADYAGYYPPANGGVGLETLRKNDYLTDYAVFTCPSIKTVRGKNDQPLTEVNVDYVYVGGLNTKSNPNLPLLYDKANNHGYFGNVLFADCSVAGIYGNPWTTNIRKGD